MGNSALSFDSRGINDLHDVSWEFAHDREGARTQTSKAQPWGRSPASPFRRFSLPPKQEPSVLGLCAAQHPFVSMIMSPGLHRLPSLMTSVIQQGSDRSLHDAPTLSQSWIPKSKPTPALCSFWGVRRGILPFAAALANCSIVQITCPVFRTEQN